MSSQNQLIEQQLKSANSNKYPKPILKWAGGKSQILNPLLNRLPTEGFSRYFEPMIGGGAFFFKLRREGSYISDINNELINLYQVIRDNVDELINSLEEFDNHKQDMEYYYSVRVLDRSDDFDAKSDIEKAARTIFLNRTCFNGLYRVNSKGQFNVPFGRYKNPRIIDEINLKACSSLLKTTEIVHGSFELIESVIGENDFAYIDPPYVPLSKTSSFTQYTKEDFNLQSQEQLKQTCDVINDKGASFMLSNSDTEFVRDLYNDSNYFIDEIAAMRAINSKAKGRGKINELVITNYKYTLHETNLLSK